MVTLLRGISLLAVAVTLFGADTDGTWRSDERYNGEPRVVIEVRTTAGKVGGTVVMRGVMDDDNNVTTLNLTIDAAELSGASLRFKTKLPDDNVQDWEVTVNGATATASIVGDNDGPYTTPQTWKMKKQGSS